jgi:Ala-tRNA(Pro) deacylase
MAKFGKKVTKYILVVVPGDRRLNLSAVKSLLGATYISFASADVAERLAGSVVGTVLPFAFNPAFELIADPSLRHADQPFFNAARLDRSVALRTEDYFAIAKPRIECIAVV